MIPKMKNLTLPLMFLAAIGFDTARAAESGRLQAGAATSNITPPLGTLRVGSFAPYPTVHVHDELHASCLVLNDGKTSLVLVVCDLLGLHRSVSIEARRLMRFSPASTLPKAISAGRSRFFAHRTPSAIR